MLQALFVHGQTAFMMSNGTLHVAGTKYGP